MGGWGGMGEAGRDTGMGGWGGGRVGGGGMGGMGDARVVTILLPARNGNHKENPPNELQAHTGQTTTTEAMSNRDA